MARPACGRFRSRVAGWRRCPHVLVRALLAGRARRTLGPLFNARAWPHGRHSCPLSRLPPAKRRAASYPAADWLSVGHSLSEGVVHRARESDEVCRASSAAQFVGGFARERHSPPGHAPQVGSHEWVVRQWLEPVLPSGSPQEGPRHRHAARAAPRSGTRPFVEDPAFSTGIRRMRPASAAGTSVKVGARNGIANHTLADATRHGHRQACGHGEQALFALPRLRDRVHWVLLACAVKMLVSLRLGRQWRTVPVCRVIPPAFIGQLRESRIAGIRPLLGTGRCAVGAAPVALRRRRCGAGVAPEGNASPHPVGGRDRRLTASDESAQLVRGGLSDDQDRSGRSAVPGGSSRRGVVVPGQGPYPTSRGPLRPLPRRGQR
jgi:hypothetical protein